MNSPETRSRSTTPRNRGQSASTPMEAASTTTSERPRWYRRSRSTASATDGGWFQGVRLPPPRMSSRPRLSDLTPKSSGMAWFGFGAILTCSHVIPPTVGADGVAVRRSQSQSNICFDPRPGPGVFSKYGSTVPQDHSFPGVRRRGLLRTTGVYSG